MAVSSHKALPFSCLAPVYIKVWDIKVCSLYFEKSCFGENSKAQSELIYCVRLQSNLGSQQQKCLEIRNFLSADVIDVRS